MFKKALACVFALSSLTASAAEQARLALPSNVLAQTRTFGGLSPVPNDSGIQILADGTVVSFNRNRNPQQIAIARLSSAKLADLRTAAAGVRISRLVLASGTAMCTDTPITEYSINAGRAGTLVVGRWANCQQFVDTDAQGNQLHEALKGLEALDQL